MRLSRTSNNISPIECIIAFVNYLTYGLVGFIYLILVALKKCKLTSFLQYHIFLTFFLVILYWLITVFLSLVVQILSVIPFINILVVKLLFYFNAPIFFNKFSIISGGLNLFVIYLCFNSLMGRFTYIPWVSNIIRANIRH